MYTDRGVLTTLYFRILARLWSALISVGNRRSSSVMVAAMMSSSLRPIHFSAGANTSSSMDLSVVGQQQMTGHAQERRGGQHTGKAVSASEACDGRRHAVRPTV